MEKFTTSPADLSDVEACRNGSEPVAILTCEKIYENSENITWNPNHDGGILCRR